MSCFVAVSAGAARILKLL